MDPVWIDTHRHLDAPEFSGVLPAIIAAAKEKNVRAILLPAVRASDFKNVNMLVDQYQHDIPGLVYT